MLTGLPAEDCIAPIEKAISEVFGPFVGNTHSEESITGSSMTLAYHHSHEIIKKHVNAKPRLCYHYCRFRHDWNGE